MNRIKIKNNAITVALLLAGVVSSIAFNFVKLSNILWYILYSVCFVGFSVLFSAVFQKIKLELHGKMRIIIKLFSSFFALASFVLLYKGDTGYLGADTAGFWWHQLPLPVVLIIFCCVYILVIALKDTIVQKEYQKIQGIWFWYVVWAVLYALTVVYFDVFKADIYHIDAFMHPIYNIYYGTPYSEISYGLYGHYELLYQIPMMIFGTSPVVICGVLFVTSFLTATCLFGIVENVVSSKVIRLIIPIILLLPSGVMYRNCAFQAIPHRIFFPVLILWFILQEDKFSKKCNYIILANVICCMSILVNTESGLFTCAGWSLYLILNAIRTKSFRWSYLLKIILARLLNLGIAILVVNVYNFIHGGGVFVKEFFFPYTNSTFLSHYTYELPGGITPYLIAFLLGLAFLCGTSIKVVIGRSGHKEIIFIAAVAIVLLGELSYYIVRPAYYALMVVYPFFLILIAYLIELKDKVHEELAKTLLGEMSQYAMVIVAVLLIMSAGVIEKISIQSINGFYDVTTYEQNKEYAQNVIGERIYALGEGVDELYGVLGWDAGYHLFGTTDVLYDPEANSKVYDQLVDEANQQNDVLLCETAYKQHNPLYEDYKMTKEMVLYNRKYAIYTKDKYVSSEQITGEENADINIMGELQYIGNQENYYSILIKVHNTQEAMDDRDYSRLRVGLLDRETGQIISAVTSEVEMLPNNEYESSEVGIYGRIRKEELNFNYPYEVIILENVDDKVVHYVSTGMTL